MVGVEEHGHALLVLQGVQLLPIAELPAQHELPNVHYRVLHNKLFHSADRVRRGVRELLLQAETLRRDVAAHLFQISDQSHGDSLLPADDGYELLY